MTTLRQIVSDAYRESGIIQQGVAPTAGQLDEGLRKLKSLISQKYTNEVGGPYVDLNFGKVGVTSPFGRERDKEAFIANSFVRPNYRILFNIDTAKDVFLTPFPKDGSMIAVIDVQGNFSSNPVTLKGNGRKIENSSEVVLNTDGVNAEWVYRADLANWQRIDTLTENSESPFPSKFDDYFMYELAMRLNPRYLVDTRQESAMAYRDVRKKFKAQYSTNEETPVEMGLYRTTNFRYLAYQVDNDSIRFDHGIIY